TVALAPYDFSRQINIESSVSGGVLSLTPTMISRVSTPGVLEIGRSDGNANMVVSTPLASTDVNAGTLRLYSGNISLNSGIGSSGTPLDHHLDFRANNDFDLIFSNIYLANNRNLTIVADNDSSGFGNITLSGGTVQVGSNASNTTGNMSLTGRSLQVLGAGGGSLVAVTGTGTQTFTTLDPAGQLRINNQSTGSGDTVLVRANGGTQTFNAAGALRIIAGAGTGTTARAENTGVQNVTAGTIEITGGSSGTSNDAGIFQLNAASTQTVSAGGMTLSGGTSGGGLGIGNVAYLSSAGNQSVTVGSGGLTLSGGGGTGSETDNAAILIQTGTTGTSQTITVNSGGAITLSGGSSALTGVGATHGSRALIEADGDSQLIQFNSGGSIVGNAGTVGSRNYAVIYAQSGTQTITGSPSISLTGGSSGGITGEGNYTHIWSDVGTQTITASGITLKGGTSGTENRAQIGISGASANQVINITGGGTVSLIGQGGTD
ncbi:MAG TPA: hypothetical protein VLB27_04885, partial [candidate division Zixibacteria bacterium]|nr:hypothetical protein [candidate division Zixibacteria bacterium]